MPAHYKTAAPYAADARSLPVRDLDAALPFYLTVMGFRVVSRSESAPHSAILGRDDVEIGLSENGGDPEQEGCFFEVDDVEAAWAELRANGLGQEAPGFRSELRGHVTYKIFFVIAPDGLCYCLGRAAGVGVPPPPILGESEQAPEQDRSKTRRMASLLPSDSPRIGGGGTPGRKTVPRRRTSSQNVKAKAFPSPQEAVMRVVAISGSLRPGSTNSALVRAAAEAAPEGVSVTVYEGLAALPHFSPELDGPPLGPADVAPRPVQEFRALLGEADGVLIGTPEYAYGIPGSLKNALDWLVPSGELWRKPVAVFSASPSALGGEKALAALRLTLSALEAEVVEGAFPIPFARSKVAADGRVSDPDTVKALRVLMVALAGMTAERRQ